MSNQKICDICGEVLHKNPNATQYQVLLGERTKVQKKESIETSTDDAPMDLATLMTGILSKPNYEEKHKTFDFCETHYRELQQIFFNMMKNIGKEATK